MIVALGEVAFARSGDKGENVNIGVAFPTQELYAWGAQVLTSQKVQDHFRSSPCTRVTRYELPNLRALNFILHGALPGGGAVTLQLDAQGKTFGQALLIMKVDIPAHLSPAR